MRELTLVFSNRPENLFSRLISRQQEAPYSHVSLHLESKYLGRSLVYEASVFGVRLLTLSKWRGLGNLIVAEKTFAVTDEDRRRAIVSMVDRLGTPYGFWSLFGILFGSRKIGNNGKAGEICSEAAYEILLNLGLIEPLTDDSDYIEPKELYEALL